MDKHALLSASSAHRWLVCPPSARLCEKWEDNASEYAREGTAAHTLCQYKLERAIGSPVEDPVENLSYYDAEMESCAESYAEYVTEEITETKKTCNDPVILIEQRLDYSKWVEEGFGTGDCVIVADGTMTVIDFKYGKGIEVSAEMNPQIMCYALGALEMFDTIYDIQMIRMTIFQPRRENISTYETGRKELLDWANNILAPAAKQAYVGEGEFTAGEHCRFCGAKAVCRKRAEYNLELAKYDFQTPPMLEDAEIEVILAKADEMAAWTADVKEYALNKALSGKRWKGWKLVEGRSNRKYVSNEAVAQTVMDAGYNPYEKKLLGITAMTALLGRKTFTELIESKGLIEKPSGKPTLVPESDKRPAINTAKNDFEEERIS